MAVDKILTFGTGKVGSVGSSKLFGFKPFFPTNISDIVIWLNNDASTMTLSGANKVSQWSDSSGNLNDFVQGTGSLQPEFIANGINGQNGVYFNPSANNALDLSSISGGTTFTQPFEIYAVYSNEAGSTSPVVYDRTVASGNRVLLFWQSNFIKVASPTVNNTLAQTTPFGLTNIGVEYNSPSTKVYKNGILSATTNTGTDGLTSLRIGNADGIASSTRLRGYICELIVYSRALTLSEKGLVNTYLNSKYGL